jgi:hypothetical protein
LNKQRMDLQDHEEYTPEDPSTWSSWLHTQDNLLGQSNYAKYVSALYWSLSTLSTVGYGDVTPIVPSEKITAMMGMVLGVTVPPPLLRRVSRKDVHER